MPRGRNRPLRASWPFVKRDTDSVDKIEGGQEKTPVTISGFYTHMRMCTHMHTNMDTQMHMQKKEV